MVSSETLPRVVGRERELAVVRGFLAADDQRSLVLNGGAGIGKTTLWETGIQLARERGARVLAIRPHAAEAGLAFAGLIDLCDGVGAGAFAELPRPQRRALELALLRVEPAADEPGPEPHAIALGLRGVLRALAAERPLVLAVDDIQWLDRGSTEALLFVARRLTDEPIMFLLARRSRATTELERALERHGVKRVDVGPLGLAATRHLLSGRLALSLTRPQLRSIVDATLGNPLFALEVGRTLVEQGLPGAGDDLPVPPAIEDLLGTRVARLDDTPRRLLLAVALSGHLHVDELAAIEGPDAVDDAVEEGLLRIERERVRASHPLLAAAARQRSRRQERLDLYRALAAVVSDEQLRALHLARATRTPDNDLARVVASAAAAAAARGGRQQAARLAEHALRLTPPASAERDERLLALGGYLARAGEQQRLTELLEPAVESLAPGAARASAWLLLAEGTKPKTLADLEQLLARALAECENEPSVLAYALAKKSCLASATAVAQLDEAEAWALEALVAAAGDRDNERFALYSLGWVRAMRGHSIDDLCERSRAATDASSYILAAPERVAGQRLVWRGEIGAARALLGRLTALADERGEPASYALQRLHMCELDLRTGDWDAAEQRLDEWAQSAEGQALIRPMYHRCRALLAAGRGLPGPATTWAAEAITRAEAVGCRWDWLEARRAQGMIALLERDPARAIESLRPAWQHLQDERIGDPGIFPVAPELVEALVEAGEHEEARDVGERLHAQAQEREHPWGLITARRCRAVVRLAEGDADAAQELEDVAAEYGRLGLRYERARTLLSLGRAQRRRKSWGGAREALECAAGAFDELGSSGWAELTRAELARVGGRRPRASGELTPTEREAVELAAGGMANKEIAAAMYMGVHTVEVHLSRAYAKLGVRSRGQLAARLSLENP